MTKERLLTFIGFLLLVVGWHIASLYMHELILSSPKDTFLALWKILDTDYFKKHFWVSMQRVSLGLFIGCVAGFVLGIIAGLYKEVRCLLEPIRWLLMSLPPIILVVLSMLWFGMGSTMAIFIISMVTAPIVYINIYKGIDMVDEHLIEMAQIYNFSLWTKLTTIYVPAIVTPLSATMVMIIDAGARMVVMAELLGTNNGIGFVVGEARSNLEIPLLFAWILMVIIVVAIVEFGVLHPMHNYLMRWKNEK